MTPTKARIYTGSGSPIDDYHNPKKQLENIVSGGRNTGKENWGFFDKNNQQHKAVLSQLRQLQWTTKSERWGEVADINRLSEFLKSDKSPVKKPLKDMEPQEVSKIIECLKSMITKKYK
jgi:hypothetical protein